MKYEWDELCGRLRVDRLLYSAVYAPFNYGYLLGTKETEDGDFADVVIYSSHPIISGAVIRVRIVGLLEMEDEAGIDNKFISVPDGKIDPQWSKINVVTEVPESIRKQTVTYFENYKQLEPKKWTRIKGFASPAKLLKEWQKIYIGS